VVDFISKHKDYFESNKLSFFEMTVGMAFDYFNSENVDIAIIEVGMGGRLDSTNIIDPEISIITNIGLDHTKFLGDNLKQIATEKAGIIKEGKTIIIGETQKDISDVFINKAKELNADIIFADQEKSKVYKSDLKGSYQNKNIQTALCAIKELQISNWKISEDSIIAGLSRVSLNTGFIGRWTVLSQSPLTICDTAHNNEGLSIVLKDLLSLNYSKLHFVIGFVEDKNMDSIIELFPENSNYYFCKPDIKRGFNEIDLKSNFESKLRFGNSYLSVQEALKSAKSKSSNNDIIFIGGSTFVVAEVI